MLIILDRDGVINTDSPNYVKTPDEWCAIPGSLEAIARLKQAQHTVCVATNQSGIARNYYTKETLDAIHQKMQDALAEHGAIIDGIFYCPHHDIDQCDCRKPKPGLLLQIQQQFPTPWNETIFIGDSIRDLQAAKAADCPSILVATGNGRTTLEQHQPKVPYYPDLAAAVDDILGEA